MDVEDLEVYRLAEELVLMVYKKTKNFPDSERYGLTSQLNRAAVSIPVNIAESQGRYHFKERIQFLYVARGSLVETWSLLRIAQKLRMIEPDERLDSVIMDLKVKLNNFISSIKRKVNKV